MLFRKTIFNNEVINIQQEPAVDSHPFINLTNHPSKGWSKEQLEAAKQYGEIVDLPFPAVPADASAGSISDIADEVVQQVNKLTQNNTDSTIHVMGEMNLTYILVGRLQHLGYRCVASTTVRNAVDNPDGTKTIKFEFIQFREYGE